MSQTAEEMKKIARAPVEVKYGMPLLSNSNKDFLSQDLSKIISKDAMNILEEKEDDSQEQIRKDVRVLIQSAKEFLEEVKKLKGQQEQNQNSQRLGSWQLALNEQLKKEVKNSQGQEKITELIKQAFILADTNYQEYKNSLSSQEGLSLNKNFLTSLENFNKALNKIFDITIIYTYVLTDSYNKTNKESVFYTFTEGELLNYLSQKKISRSGGITLEQETPEKIMEQRKKLSNVKVNIKELQGDKYITIEEGDYIYYLKINPHYDIIGKAFQGIMERAFRPVSGKEYYYDSGRSNYQQDLKKIKQSKNAPSHWFMWKHYIDSKKYQFQFRALSQRGAAVEGYIGALFDNDDKKKISYRAREGARYYKRESTWKEAAEHNSELAVAGLFDSYIYQTTNLPAALGGDSYARGSFVVEKKDNGDLQKMNTNVEIQSKANRASLGSLSSAVAMADVIVALNNVLGKEDIYGEEIKKGLQKVREKILKNKMTLKNFQNNKILGDFETIFRYWGGGGRNA